MVKLSQIVHVGGVKGVGKSAVLNQVLRDSSGYHTLNIGELLTRYSIEKYNSGFERLGQTEKSQLRLYLRSLISANENTILDSHYTIQENGRIVRVFPQYAEELVDRHVVVVATAEQILERRQKDYGKIRDIDMDAIKHEAEVELRTARKIAETTKKPIYIIQNLTIETAASSLIRLLCG